MEIQNLSSIDASLVRLIKKNPSRSVSATFRRFQKRLPLIGDIPLMKHIILEFRRNGVPVSRDKVTRSLKYLPEYREISQGKQAMIDELCFCGT